MKKIFYTFLTRPITTAMFFFSVVVAGVVSVLNLPVELGPNVEYPRLSVSVSWSGVSAGKKVIIEGQYTLAHDAKVRVIRQ
jgi:multidrug efflux pump subunit AcrB